MAAFNWASAAFKAARTYANQRLFPSNRPARGKELSNLLTTSQYIPATIEKKKKNIYTYICVYKLRLARTHARLTYSNAYARLIEYVISLRDNIRPLEYSFARRRSGSLDDHLRYGFPPSPPLSRKMGSTRAERDGISRIKTEYRARNGKNIAGITFRGCWCGKWADGRINNRGPARRRFIQLNANVEWKGRPLSRSRAPAKRRRGERDSSGRWAKKERKEKRKKRPGMPHLAALIAALAVAETARARD